MERPYRNLRAEELRALYQARPSDGEYLASIVSELAQRRTRQARDLLAEVSAHLGTLDASEDESIDFDELAGAPEETRLEPEGAEGSEYTGYADRLRECWGDSAALEELASDLARSSEPGLHIYLGQARQRALQLRSGSTGATLALTTEDAADTPEVRPADAPSFVELRAQLLQHWDDRSGLASLREEVDGRPGLEATYFRKHIDERLEELALEAEPAAPVPSERTRHETGAASLLELRQEGEALVRPPAIGGESVNRNGRSEVAASSDPLPTRWESLATGDSATAPSVSRCDTQDPEFHGLRAASDHQEYELHLAACDWDLDPAILIHGANDIQARVHWQGLLTPFEHQVRNLITFCRRAPVALIADDVGLGKTVSAGLILSELLIRGKVRRALIVVPKTALLAQWKGELEERFKLSAEHARGAELSARIADGTEIVVTTYDSARGRMDQLERSGFDMIVLDEAHRLRNLHGAQSPPRIATSLREAFERRAFRYVLMLTATPIQNRLWDLYSLVDLLSTAKGHENPLGDPNAFARLYIADGKAEARQLHTGRRDEFRRILSQYMVRTRRADAGLVFPERRLKMVRAQGCEGEDALSRLVGELIGSLNPLTQTSVAQALMSSPEALVNQLDNMSQKGSIERATYIKAKVLSESIRRTAKAGVLLQVLERLREEGGDSWRAVIFTGRKATQDAIGRAIEEHFGSGLVGFIRGGDHDRNVAAIQGYTENPPRTQVIISTDAGTEGLNLQAGNVVINYDLPWNPMVLEQRIGRVQRLGSKFDSIVVFNLVLAGSVEEHVVGRLAEKLSAISSTLGDIEGILESLPGGSSDEEGLEKQIRDLVVRSLQGMDVEESVRRIQASVDRAKEIYEDEKEVVERQLGSLDAMHEQGPRMPELSPIKPRLSERDFVLAALRSDGGSLQELEGGRWRYDRPGYAPEEVVFTREDLERYRPSGFAGGPSVSLYASGQPAFEKLGERWRRRSQHAITDMRGAAVSSPDELAAAWLTRLGDDVEFKTAEVCETRAAFRGELVIRGAASVAHDKYEKILNARVRPANVELPEAPEAAAAVLGQSVPLDEVAERDRSFGDAVRKAIHEDSDLQQFSGFYLRRMDEELEKVGQDNGRQALLKESFTPRLTSAVVGAAGGLYAIADIRVSFELEGEQGYACELGVLPALGRVVSEPDFGECAATGRSLPVDCLANCQREGVSVIKHRLTRSASGRLAQSKFAVTCEASGSVFLDDEVGESSVSGKVVDRRLLVASDVSQQLALEDEMVTCGFTGATCLPSEVAQSEVSGKPFRNDEGAVGGRDQVTGHRSEFVQCSVSQKWLLPKETVKSAISDRAFDESLAVSSEKSGRIGGPGEHGICAASGRTLLSDELGVCEATRNQVDRELLAQSASSGRWAQRSQMVLCEKSGNLVLNDETKTCAVTGARVETRFLTQCVVSGEHALLDSMERCAVTGQPALPVMLETCVVSGSRALPSQLLTCAVSGRRALPSEMIPDACRENAPIIKSEAGYSEVSGRGSHPASLVRCMWDGQQRLPDEVAECSLTGIRVGIEHAREDGRLSSLVALQESRDWGEALEGGLARELEIEGLGAASQLQGVRSVASPTGIARAVTGVHSRMLGWKKVRVSFIQAESGELIGRPVISRA